jgi:hypothetical protein
VLEKCTLRLPWAFWLLRWVNWHRRTVGNQQPDTQPGA